MGDARGPATIILGHALLTILLGIRVLAGGVKMGRSPFDGWFNGMTARAYQNEEIWEKSHRYNAKRRIVWALGEIIVALILYFVPLPQFVVIGLYIISSSIIIYIPSIETARYIKRLSQGAERGSATHSK